MSVQWCLLLLAALFAGVVGYNSSLIAEVTVSSQAVRVRGGESASAERAEVRPVPRMTRALKKEPTTQSDSASTLYNVQPHPFGSASSIKFENITDSHEERVNSTQNFWTTKKSKAPSITTNTTDTSLTAEEDSINRTTTEIREPHVQKDELPEKSKGRNARTIEPSQKNDGTEKGRGHMKKLKKQMKKIAPYLMIPGMMALGYAPFILASLKMFVMNAVTLNMMAFNAAIFLTLRNMVFGPRRGQHVKYHNFGYKKRDSYPHPHHHHYHNYH